MKRVKKFFKKGKESSPRRSNEPGQNDDNEQVQAVDVPFPDGVIPLKQPSSATIDICFIHGLTGNRLTTWTAAGKTKPWPEELLPEQIDSARILTFGYDAYVVKKAVASSNELRNHARDFCHDIVGYRRSTKTLSRPLILVAHSLGGLVAKEAILFSRNNPEPHLEDLFLSVVGIAFMGVPHRGSWIADWALIPAHVLGIFKSTNKTLIDVLRTENQFLKSVQDRFWNMVRELQVKEAKGEAGRRRIEVTCFYEALPLGVIDKKVVDEASATLESYSSISIHANHSDMVKFATAEDNGFKRVVGELIRWKDGADEMAAKAQEPSEGTKDRQVASKKANPKTAGSVVHNINRGSGTQMNNTGGGSQYVGRDQYFGAVTQSRTRREDSSDESR